MKPTTWLLLPALAWALCGSAAAEGTLWKDAVPANQDPAEPAPTCTADGGYSSSDDVILRDQQQKGVFDDVCPRNWTINFNKDLNFAGFHIGEASSFGRELKKLPCGRQGLIDRLQIQAYADKAVQVFQQPGDAGSLFASARLSGMSAVMRPLREASACSALPEYVSKPKFVLPFSAESIAGMAVGEYWQLPLQITLGAQAAVSGGSARDDGGTQSASLVLDGWTDDGQTSVTLYRLSKDKVRFRFRIQNATVHTKYSVNPVYTFPAIAINVHGVILAKFFSSLMTRQMTRYVDAFASIAEVKQDSTKMVLELVLDPNDSEQLEALTSLVHGELGQLFRLLAKQGGFLPKVVSERLEKNRNASLLPQVDPDEITRRYVDKTGATDHATYRGGDRGLVSDPKSLKIPFFFQGAWDDSLGEQPMLKLNSGEGEVRIYQAAASAQKSHIDVPLLGPRIRDTQTRTSQAIVADDPSTGGIIPPRVVYMQAEAFKSVIEGGVRWTAAAMARTTSMIGAERLGGPNPDTRLPAPELLPRKPAPAYEEQTPGGSMRTYGSGQLRLDLRVAPEGVAKIVAASGDSQRVLRAFERTLDAGDAAVVDAMAKAGFSKNAVFDQARAASAAAMDSVSPSYYLALAKKSQNLVAALAGVSAAGDYDSQARALATTLGGRGPSDISHEDILNVVLQFVDADDVKADFRAEIGDKDAKLAKNLQLNGGIDSDPFIHYVGKLREHFMPPTDVKD